MWRLLVGFVALLAICVAAADAQAADEIALAAEAAPIHAFLRTHCLKCHSGAKPKGELSLASLIADFRDQTARKHWQRALERVLSGEMPPEDAPRPTAAEIAAFAAWSKTRAEIASAARRATGRVVLRRLNRVEYENTLRDLLGIDADLQSFLPPDQAAEGFDNNAESLHLSSFLMDRYLEAADAALAIAIANRSQPKLFKKRYDCREERHVKTTTEKVFLPRDDALVCFSSSPWQAITMWSFYPNDRGRYRIRITAYGYQSEGKPVSYRVDAGSMLMGQKSHLIDYFDAAADKPTVVEFVDHLEAHGTVRILPYGLASAQSVDKIGADKFTGPGLAIQSVEIEGPLYDIWPPESHRRIFGDLPQKPLEQGRLEVVSEQPLDDARRILRGFVRRAYRRAITDDDLKPFLALVEARLATKYTFEQAVRVALQAVLVSPDFLFLREKPGRLSDFALASRLSYFLWSTMPDEELLTLAEQGKLREPAMLRKQVERMLASPRSAKFVENFTGQWLGLRDIDFTVPDHLLYPEWDDLLKEAMLKEARGFFREVLEQDLSLTNFVASDFTFLNERLAKHYGIEGVVGQTMRKVALPPGSHRGGVLTMAAVLKVTANGTSTSPVVRGSWVLDRILGTPPNPPPAGVPAIEPDIRGATTMREQLAKHRQVASCATCHVKIDPPGFALESFDVIGGWREHYRSIGRGQPVTIDGRRMHYAQGPAVDPSDVLPDGRKFRDIDELKQLLLADKDQLARALTRKLVAYSTGAAAQEEDALAVEAIVAQSREGEYGLRSLVMGVVESELFLRK